MSEPPSLHSSAIADLNEVKGDLEIKSSSDCYGLDKWSKEEAVCWVVDVMEDSWVLQKMATNGCSVRICIELEAKRLRGSHFKVG